MYTLIDVIIWQALLFFVFFFNPNLRTGNAGQL